VDGAVNPLNLTRKGHQEPTQCKEGGGGDFRFIDKGEEEDNHSLDRNTGEKTPDGRAKRKRKNGIFHPFMKRDGEGSVRKKGWRPGDHRVTHGENNFGQGKRKQ